VTLWTNLRALVYLRQISRALTRSAIAAEQTLRLAQQEFDLAHPDPILPPKSTLVFDTFDPTAANKLWREQRLARGEEIPDLAEDVLP